MRRSTNYGEHSIIAARPALRWRVLFNILTLLSFLAQGYLVQTHIHGLPTAFAAQSAKQIASQTPNGNLPGDDDQATCLLCQEYIQAGNFLTPAAIAVLPPTAVASVISLDALSVIVSRPASHFWRGRAPPHA